MKTLISLIVVSLLGSMAQAAVLEISCSNYRTQLTFTLNQGSHVLAKGVVEDKEKYVTKGPETYEFYYDMRTSLGKTGATYTTSNDDYLIEVKFPKMILSKIPRKTFKAEFTPYFDGLRPRHNTLNCTAQVK